MTPRDSGESPSRAASLVVDGWDREGWTAALDGFPERSLYQAWDYAELHSPGSWRRTVRAAWVESGEVRAMGQMRVKTLPVFPIGAAELEWGPLHRTLDDLRRFLEAVRVRIGERNGWEIRVHPRSTGSLEGDAGLVETFEAAGFRRDPSVRPYRTVVLDLRPDVETLMKNLHGSWRRQLRKAQDSGLVLEEGDSVEYFDRFSKVYAEMWGSKQFATGVRHPVVRRLVETLPGGEKFRISIAAAGGRDVGASVCSEIGDACLYFLGASTPGLREDCRPGHLLHWNNVLRAKERGLNRYDLGGIVDTGEGVNRFKRGMGGEEWVYPGCFTAGCDGPWARVMRFAEMAFRGIRRLAERR